MDPFASEAIADLQSFNGVSYPLGVRFRQLLVTGPPGSGKSTRVAQIKGWPEEGGIDLSAPRWWTSRDLAVRPREVHLALPLAGFEHGMTVFDPQWQKQPLPQLEPERIQIPPPKRHFLSVDWRNRYLFEFLLPPAETILAWRLQRRGREYHPADDTLDDAVDNGRSLGTIEAQVARYRQAALTLHRHGMQVILRQGDDDSPHRFTATTE